MKPWHLPPNQLASLASGIVELSLSFISLLLVLVLPLLLFLNTSPERTSLPGDGDLESRSLPPSLPGSLSPSSFSLVSFVFPWLPFATSEVWQTSDSRRPLSLDDEEDWLPSFGFCSLGVCLRNLKLQQICCCLLLLTSKISSIASTQIVC